MGFSIFAETTQSIFFFKIYMLSEGRRRAYRRISVSRGKERYRARVAQSEISKKRREAELRDV